MYRIYSAIRWSFPLSKLTTNNIISPLKFCYSTSFTLPKQSQRSRSVLLNGSRFLGLFWKEKNTVLKPKKYGAAKPLISVQRYIRASDKLRFYG